MSHIFEVYYLWSGFFSAVSLQRLSSKYKHAVPSSSQSKSPADGRQEEVYSHSSVSLLSQATFWWLTPLLWKGAAKPLELSDLGKLPKEEGTERCYHTFNQCYEALKVSTFFVKFFQVLLLQINFERGFALIAFRFLFRFIMKTSKNKILYVCFSAINIIEHTLLYTPHLRYTDCEQSPLMQVLLCKLSTLGQVM